jgi:hypothetical protein
MSHEEYLDALERWAHEVLDDSARLAEDLSDHELRERQARWYADFYTRIGDPDGEALRSRLIEEEGMSPDFADEVLARM